MVPALRFRPALGLAALVLAAAAARAQDPPALNPFGAAPGSAPRDDALPGVLHTSDGKSYAGQVFLTRDARLRIYDETQKRQRDVPLTAIRKLECRVVKEWLEPEWRFKENANDEKVFTGRAYPSREYVHTLTLKDGRTLTGPLSAIVYVRPESGEPARFLLHKRDKGAIDTPLDALLYVRSIDLDP